MRNPCVFAWVLAIPSVVGSDDTTALLQTSAKKGDGLENDVSMMTAAMQSATAEARNIIPPASAAKRLVSIAKGLPASIANVDKQTVPLVPMTSLHKEIKQLQESLRPAMREMTVDPTGYTSFIQNCGGKIDETHHEKIRASLVEATEQYRRNTHLHQQLLDLIPRLSRMVNNQKIMKPLMSAATPNDRQATNSSQPSFDPLLDNLPELIKYGSASPVDGDGDGVDTVGAWESSFPESIGEEREEKREFLNEELKWIPKEDDSAYDGLTEKFVAAADDPKETRSVQDWIKSNFEGAKKKDGESTSDYFKRIASTVNAKRSSTVEQLANKFDSAFPNSDVFLGSVLSFGLSIAPKSGLGLSAKIGFVVKQKTFTRKVYNLEGPPIVLAPVVGVALTYEGFPGWDEGPFSISVSATPEFAVPISRLITMPTLKKMSLAFTGSWVLDPVKSTDHGVKYVPYAGLTVAPGYEYTVKYEDTEKQQGETKEGFIRRMYRAYAATDDAAITLKKFNFNAAVTASWAGKPMDGGFQIGINPTKNWKGFKISFGGAFEFVVRSFSVDNAFSGGLSWAVFPDKAPRAVVTIGFKNIVEKAKDPPKPAKEEVEEPPEIEVPPEPAKEEVEEPPEIEVPPEPATSVEPEAEKPPAKEPDYQYQDWDEQWR